MIFSSFMFFGASNFAVALDRFYPILIYVVAETRPFFFYSSVFFSLARYLAFYSLERFSRSSRSWSSAVQLVTQIMSSTHTGVLNPSTLSI